MDWEKARYFMVEQQIRPWDVLNQSILDLLLVLKREEFVPASHRDMALVDMEIPLAGSRCGSPKWKPVLPKKLP
jgi:protein-L-isoaspartate(D-aspartate) O-methyltransferase